MSRPLRERIVRNSREPVMVRVLDIARCVDLDGLGSAQVALRFCRPVAWYRRTECQTFLTDVVGFRHSITGNFNDFFGYMTSAQDPLEGAQADCARRHITRDSKEIVEVVLTIYEDAGVPPPNGLMDGPYYGAHPYLHVPDDWVHDDENLERWLRVVEGVDNDAERFLDENRRNFVSETVQPRALVIWSSRNTEAENQAALALAHQDPYA